MAHFVLKPKCVKAARFNGSNAQDIEEWSLRVTDGSVGNTVITRGQSYLAVDFDGVPVGFWVVVDNHNNVFVLDDINPDLFERVLYYDDEGEEGLVLE